MNNPRLTTKDFRQLRDIVYQYSGITLSDQKIDLVRGRLMKRIRFHGLTSFTDYCKILKGRESEDEMTAFIDAISTNKTDFFRENAHFEFLQQEVLPGLIDEKRGQSIRRMRAWCAACSTGEEPYTLALVLRRLGLSDTGNWDCKILATDISSKVLQLAVDGEYDPDRVTPIPPEELRSCFQRLKSGKYRVKNSQRKMINFGRLNLLQESYPFKGPFDFIFCRNVMIYFDAPTRERLVNRFFQYLRSGGYLFVGHSESLSGLTHPFAYVKPSIYRKGSS